jgi:hypothetical protein
MTKDDGLSLDYETLMINKGREQVMREFLEELEKQMNEGNLGFGKGMVQGFSAAIFVSEIKKKYEEELKRC